jgi:MFS family permease
MYASICAGYVFSAVSNSLFGHMGWRYVFLSGMVPAFLAIYIRLRLIEVYPAQPKQSTFEPFRIISTKHLKKTLIILALGSTAIINKWAVLSWVPAWVSQLVGGPAIAERSTVTFAMYSGSVIASLLALNLVPKLGRRRSFALAFGGTLLFDLLLFLCAKDYGFLLIALCFTAGVFEALPYLYMYAIVPELFPANVRGTAFGISIQTGRIFAAIAALASGKLIAVFHGSYTQAASTLAFLNLIGFGAAWLLPEDENYLSSDAIDSN